MFITRRQVMLALFNLLQQKNTQKLIVGFSRKFVTPDKISGSASMPYLMLCKPKENYPQKTISALPAKRTFLCEIIIWIQEGQNQAAIPQDTVDDILDYLDEALQPDKRTSHGGALTLGGLVDSCFIEGEITTVPGDIDGIGMMHIPVKIVLP